MYQKTWHFNISLNYTGCISQLKGNFYNISFSNLMVFFTQTFNGNFWCLIIFREGFKFRKRKKIIFHYFKISVQNLNQEISKLFIFTCQRNLKITIISEKRIKLFCSNFNCSFLIFSFSFYIIGAFEIFQVMRKDVSVKTDLKVCF